MLTIYFDTNFYVDLAWAEDVAADAILNSLNELKVRGVFSHTIMREMLPNSYYPERDELLVRRLKKLKQGFLFIDEGTWDWLLVTDGARDQIRTSILETRSGMDEAESWAASAVQPMTDEEADQMLEVNRDQFAEMRMLDADGNPDPLGGIQSLRPIFESLQLPGTMKSAVLEMMDLAEQAATAPESERQALNEEIQTQFARFQELGSALAPDVVEQRNARRDIFRNDERPKDIVLGKNREKRLKQVSNSYRDAEHIGRFIANREKIDFLQIDGPNYRRFNDPAAKEPSRLEKLGLLKRCFSVSKLEEVVPTIKTLVTLQNTAD